MTRTLAGLSDLGSYGLKRLGRYAVACGCAAAFLSSLCLPGPGVPLYSRLNNVSRKNRSVFWSSSYVLYLATALRSAAMMQLATLLYNWRQTCGPLINFCEIAFHWGAPK